MESERLEILSIVTRLSPEQMQAARWCPACHAPTGMIHQRRTRRVRDLPSTLVEQVRFRCKRCGITWTAQPDAVGIGRHRSQRLRSLGVLLYLAGFSGSAAAFLLRNLGVHISAATIYRDVRDYRKQIGDPIWRRWRQTLHESLLEIRVIPSFLQIRKESPAAGTLTFLIGWLTLQLAFSHPVDPDALIRTSPGQPGIGGDICFAFTPLHRSHETAESRAM